MRRRGSRRESRRSSWLSARIGRRIQASLVEIDAAPRTRSSGPHRRRARRPLGARGL